MKLRTFGVAGVTFYTAIALAAVPGSPAGHHETNYTYGGTSITPLEPRGRVRVSRKEREPEHRRTKLSRDPIADRKVRMLLVDHDLKPTPTSSSSPTSTPGPGPTKTTRPSEATTPPPTPTTPVPPTSETPPTTTEPPVATTTTPPCG